jgi:hypothetical protein
VVGKRRPGGSPHFRHLVVLHEVHNTSVIQETKK